MDYKKYSLEKLQDWVHDALSCGEASPHEIYSAIREAVREDYYYHKDRISRATGLLELLSGHRPVANKTLTCDKDAPSPECQGAWNDFWEQSYLSGVTDTPEEAEELRNEIKELRKKDKVKKWILPVDEVQNAETGEDECFVTFPDDLLEAANLKEGDTIEWVDKGDGSYLLKKVKQTKTYYEMIEDG